MKGKRESRGTRAVYEVRYEVGKLPYDVLERMFSKFGTHDPRVVIGPRIGEDAAVLDMGDRYLVLSMDPVTFTEERIGWYCVNVNANDVAVMGAEPKWFLATLLLPEGRTDDRLIGSIFEDMASSCRSLNISLCGGHTEITMDLERPMMVGLMAGEVEKEDLVDPERIHPGDVILLTQGIAIEGTAIIAREKYAELRGVMPVSSLEKAKNTLSNPGISVVEAARIACVNARIHGMHDPTEGGLSAGLWELAMACGHGMMIDAEKVTLLPETHLICSHFNIDAWGLIASGALLIVIQEDEADKVESCLREAQIPCTPIGRVVPKDEGLWIERENRRIPILPHHVDEISKVL